ncbi:MAG: ferrous iron transport protein B [Desulfovibrio sp.]|nr:ferrous iron transport protein B [Desulfovibrio sp.]
MPDTKIHNEDNRQPLRIGLAGNPNCGKTTVFNGYTGTHQHVGNYPGVTVEKKEGQILLDGRNVTLVDLPGIYSLAAYSQEELAAREELVLANMQAVIDIVDASALERGLLLTVQLLEMGMPLVVACNMMDEAQKAGIQINMQLLAKRLNTPVLPMVARKEEGLSEVLRAAIKTADDGRHQPLAISYGPDIDEALLEMERLFESSGLEKYPYNPRFISLKFLENDPDIKRKIEKSDPELARALEAISGRVAAHIRDTLDATPESIITDYRYGFIHSILRDGTLERDPSRHRLALSDKIDAVLTNVFFGPLIMLGILYLMYQITFELGAYPQEWTEDCFDLLGDFFTAVIPEGYVQSLIVDGVIAGVGGVLSFVPLIMIMFALVSFLEDCGYMARMAYMMDRIFRFFGLHGSSVMPYVLSGGIAGGCAIPGAMATRTLKSPKEKMATLLTLPYMTCGAKLPIFILLAGAFFPENAATVMFCIMIAGWIFALLIARLLRSTIIKGAPTPFVMELPPYRMPTLFSVLYHCWERAWMYMKKAGTVLLAISVIIWASMVFPQLPEERASYFEAKTGALEKQLAELPEDSRERQEIQKLLAETNDEFSEEKLAYSVAGRLGHWLEPVTRPAGFDWRTDIALLAGIAAKEAVVSTLGTAWAMGEVDPDEPESLGERLASEPGWTKATALALMLFVLLYSPCFVALVVIRQEAGSWWWVVYSMVFNTALAYAIAVIVYQAGLRLGS